MAFESTITVRYKRLETTGPSCNVEAGVDIVVNIKPDPCALTEEQFQAVVDKYMRVARNTVDDEIAEEIVAAMARRDDEEDESGETRCRICGCTDSEACPGGCYWVDDPDNEMSDGLCSRCLEEHYPQVAAKRLAEHPDESFPLIERVEGEMDDLVHADPPGEKPTE